MFFSLLLMGGRYRSASIVYDKFDRNRSVLCLFFNTFSYGDDDNVTQTCFLFFKYKHFFCSRLHEFDAFLLLSRMVHLYLLKKIISLFQKRTEEMIEKYSFTIFQFFGLCNGKHSYE